METKTKAARGTCLRRKCKLGEYAKWYVGLLAGAMEVAGPGRSGLARQPRPPGLVSKGNSKLDLIFKFKRI
jgi:hypothetical protein